jgi:AhpD family alkylhydroperoxidase
VPNLARVLANSPAALGGYLGLAGALGGGVLPAALRERIALALAAANACEYCLSAHAAIGAGTGLAEADIAAAEAGTAPDARDAAAVAFALAVLGGRTMGRRSPRCGARAGTTPRRSRSSPMWR